MPEVDGVIQLRLRTRAAQDAFCKTAFDPSVLPRARAPPPTLLCTCDPTVPVPPPSSHIPPRSAASSLASYRPAQNACCACCVRFIDRTSGGGC